MILSWPFVPKASPRDLPQGPVNQTFRKASHLSAQGRSTKASLDRAKQFGPTGGRRPRGTTGRTTGSRAPEPLAEPRQSSTEFEEDRGGGATLESLGSQKPLTEELRSLPAPTTLRCAAGDATRGFAFVTRPTCRARTWSDLRGYLVSEARTSLQG